MTGSGAGYGSSTTCAKPQRRNTSTTLSVVPRITASGWRAAIVRRNESLRGVGRNQWKYRKTLSGGTRPRAARSTSRRSLRRAVVTQNLPRAAEQAAKQKHHLREPDAAAEQRMDRHVGTERHVRRALAAPQVDGQRDAAARTKLETSAWQWPE